MIPMTVEQAQQHLDAGAFGLFGSACAGVVEQAKMFRLPLAVALVENTMLRVDLDRARKEWNDAPSTLKLELEYDRLREDCNDYKARSEATEAEVARLTAALVNICDEPCGVFGSPSLPCGCCSYSASEARAALARLDADAGTLSPESLAANNRARETLGIHQVAPTRDMVPPPVKQGDHPMCRHATAPLSSLDHMLDEEANPPAPVTPGSGRCANGGTTGHPQCLQCLGCIPCAACVHTAEQREAHLRHRRGECGGAADDESCEAPPESACPGCPMTPGGEHKLSCPVGGARQIRLNATEIK